MGGRKRANGTRALGCLPGSRERQTPTAGSPWVSLCLDQSSPGREGCRRGVSRRFVVVVFSAMQGRRRKETGGEGREEKSLVGRECGGLVWFTERRRTGDGRSGGWQWEGDSGGGKALNWGGRGRPPALARVFWRPRTERRGDALGGGQCVQTQTQRDWRCSQPPQALGAALPYLPAGLAVPLLAWCRGVDGIVGRGGRPWPMAAAQRPSGRRLAALATACSDNAMLKIVSATRDAKFACQASLDGRLREGAHSQSGAPAALDASTTDRGCCMGLVPPAKAFHLQVATSKSDSFSLNPHTRNLPFGPSVVCEQQLPLHFDSSRPYVVAGRCCLDADQNEEGNDPNLHHILDLSQHSVANSRGACCPTAQRPDPHFRVRSLGRL